jgi:hypothetical protein
MYELFASGKAFSEHMRSAHVLGFLAAPAELTLEPLAVRAWRNIGPLPPLQDPRRHKRTARNTGAAARQEHSMTDSDPTRSSPARVQLPRPLRHRRQDLSRIPEPSATTSLRERPE